MHSALIKSFQQYSIALVVGRRKVVAKKRVAIATLFLFSYLGDLRSQLEGERSSNHPAMERRYLRSRHGHSKSR